MTPNEAVATSRVESPIPGKNTTFTLGIEAYHDTHIPAEILSEHPLPGTDMRDSCGHFRAPGPQTRFNPHIFCVGSCVIEKATFAYIVFNDRN
jgi:hypothetical protein